MQFMVTVAVCSETRMNHVNVFCGQNARPRLYSEQLSFAVACISSPLIYPPHRHAASPLLMS
jgi:hypothetical protein